METPQPKKRPYLGVDAIITDDDGRLLLIKRTGKNFAGYWSLVSGMVEWGEEVQQTVHREVMEEIGVEVEITGFTGRYYDKIGRHPTKTVICLPHFCKITKGEPSCVSECSNWGWFTPEQVRPMELAFDHKQMLVDLNLI